MSEILEESAIADLRNAKTTFLWIEAMEDLVNCLKNAFTEHLSLEDRAVYVERNATLLVVFERVSDVLARGGEQMPTGWERAKKDGLSYLGVYVGEDDESFFREALSLFEELASEGIFEKHNRIVFFGTKDFCGVASAFSAFSSNSTVLLVEPPQAVIDAGALGRIENDETQINQIPRSSIYNALSAADGVVTAFDPSVYKNLDHFKGEIAGARFFNCRHMGFKTELHLRKLHILDSLISEVASEDPQFGNLYRDLRIRRKSRQYLRQLLLKANQSERPWLEELLCKHVSAEMSLPTFTRRLRVLLAAKDQQV
ncbi:hypothetical protein [uncultured Shimia sp.]|uniref:hypothetical protein n=1 Tax=uncultured Shimia sp. TaxID=573152 RepID=UPI00263057C1|nr:hypothetical protein [uncultured Shimia sp.]